MGLDLVDGVGGWASIDLESTNILGSDRVTFAVELASGAVGVGRAALLATGAARSVVAGGTFSCDYFERQ